MANECIPYYEPGQEITGVSSAPITGCRFVKLDGASTWTPDGLKGTTTMLPTDPAVKGNVMDILPCTAGAKAIGVAGKDQAANKPVMVITGPGIVVPVAAGAALVPGNEVESDGSGRAVPASTGVKLGICLSKQATVNSMAAIKLY